MLSPPELTSKVKRLPEANSQHRMDGEAILQSCVTDFFMDPSFQSDVDSFIKENCKIFKSTSIYLDDATGGVELEKCRVSVNIHMNTWTALVGLQLCLTKILTIF